jgi:hypothetical protein
VHPARMRFLCKVVRHHPAEAARVATTAAQAAVEQLVRRLAAEEQG